MQVPTINIVMSYRSEVMRRFQELGSFKAFSEEYNSFFGPNQTTTPTTFIFKNAPNSTILSLTHSLDHESGTDLEIEIVDPDGVFEKAMIGGGMDEMLEVDVGMVPFISALLQNLRKDILDDLNDRAESTRARLRSDDSEGGLDSTFSNDELLLTPRQENLGIGGSSKNIEAFRKYYKRAEDSLTWDPQNSMSIGRYNFFMSQFRKLNESGMDIKLRLAMLEDLIEFYSPQMKRPVYIAYGAGDDLRDWSPPCCYGKIVTLEYTFDGNGVRIIKLKFVPLAHNPTLIHGFGIMPFNKAALEAGIVTTGFSYGFFNKSIAQSIPSWYTFSTDKTKKAVQKYLGDYKKPSLHWIIKTAITDFLKKGAQSDNVVVLFPNFDRFLSGYLEEVRNSVKRQVAEKPWSAEQKKIKAKVGKMVGNMWRESTIKQFLEKNPLQDELPEEEVEFWLKQENEDIINFVTYKHALEGLGFTFTETSTFDIESGDVTIESTKAGLPIGSMPEFYLEECPDANFAPAWMTSFIYRAAISCDYTDNISFLDKLNTVGQTIQKVVTDHSSEGDSSPQVSFMRNPLVITDLKVLEIMTRAGLISDSTKPAFFWGDRIFIQNFMQAYELEKNLETLRAKGGVENEVIQDATKVSSRHNLFVRLNFEKYVHPLDQVNGLTLDYMEELMEYEVPIPTLGAIGPMGTADPDTISEDFNLDNSLFSDLKKNQPFEASRLPIFTFGSTKPNILKVDMDFNAFFTAAMNQTASIPYPGQNVLTGVVKDGQKDRFDKMMMNLERWKSQWNPDTSPAPKQFIELVKPWWNAPLSQSEYEDDPTAGISASWRSGSTSMGTGDKYKVSYGDYKSDFWKGYMLIGPQGGGEANKWNSFWRSILLQVENKERVQLGISGENQLSRDERVIEPGTQGKPLFGGKVFESEDEYYSFMWKIFSRMYDRTHGIPLSEKQFTSGDTLVASVKNTLAVEEEVMRNTLRGRITTLPFFNLSTSRRTFNRPCLLLCVEPRFNTSQPHSGLEKDELQRVWFSGLYEIVGFKHTINATTAKSEFSIIRGSTKGSKLSDSIQTFEDPDNRGPSGNILKTGVESGDLNMESSAGEL